MKLLSSRRWRRLLFGLAAWFLIHVTYVTFDGLHEYSGKADAAVVLGTTVFADSSLSPWQKGRADKALTLYRQGRVKWVIASGGDGTMDWGVPEGWAIKRYLVNCGIPADSIINDDAGDNTYKSARNYSRIADSLHLSSAIVVSSFYHLTRAKYIFRRLGNKNVYGAGSDVYFWKDLTGLGREFPAFYKYLLFY